MNKEAAPSIMALALTMGAIAAGQAESYYTPNFSTPLVHGDQLVFAEAGVSPHRIISINKHDGTKLWELKATNVVIKPWLVWGEEVIATKGSEIIACDTAGRTRLVYDSQFERCQLTPFSSGKALAAGVKGTDSLSLIDLEQRRSLWEVTNVLMVLAHGSEIILCQHVDSETTERGGLAYSNPSLVAVAADDGTIIWRNSSGGQFSDNAVAVGNFFVLETSGRVTLLDQKSGRQFHRRTLSAAALNIRMKARNSDVLFEMIEGGSWLAKPAYFSLSIPELERREATEHDWQLGESSTHKNIAVLPTRAGTMAMNASTGQKLWQGGHWNWRGIHDGWIYFGVQDTNQTHVSIQGVEVTTGKQRKVYEELLPEEWQMHEDKLEQMLRARMEYLRREEKERLEQQKKRREEEQKRIEAERQLLPGESRPD